MKKRTKIKKWRINKNIKKKYAMFKKKTKLFFKGYVNELKTNKRFRLINTTVIVLLVCPLLFAFGRYVANTISEHYLNSKEFYFSSTTLTERVTDLYGWNGKSDYNIVVKLDNSKDLLNWTKEDISYEISATCTYKGNNVDCSVTGPNTLVYNEASLTKNENYVTIKRGDTTFNEGDSVEVKITAESTKPYKKTIVGNYLVYIHSLDFSYYIDDDNNREYLELVLENDTSEDKSVTIDYDETLLNIDSSNYFVKNGTTTTKEVDGNVLIDTVSITITKGSIYNLRFYKNDETQNYIGNNDILTITE